MVFERDMILNTPFVAYWEAISMRKQKIINNNNQLEIKIVKRTPIEYGIKYWCVKKTE